MDIYFTSKGNILIMDFNEWGGNSSPLLFKSWSNDGWEKEKGIRLILPPKTKLKGDVKLDC